MILGEVGVRTLGCTMTKFSKKRWVLGPLRLFQQWTSRGFEPAQSVLLLSEDLKRGRMLTAVELVCALVFGRLFG